MKTFFIHVRITNTVNMLDFETVSGKFNVVRI